jgi:hypothetical protein
MAVLEMAVLDGGELDVQVTRETGRSREPIQIVEKSIDAIGMSSSLSLKERGERRMLLVLAD